MKKQLDDLYFQDDGGSVIDTERDGKPRIRFFPISYYDDIILHRDEVVQLHKWLTEWLELHPDKGEVK